MMSEIVVPRHIAIIMDGNGRWAKKKNLPIKFGHRAGADALEKILHSAGDIGIEYLTVYAFSTENWQRPVQEVNDLMGLLNNYLDRFSRESDKNNLCIKCIGDISRLDDRLQKKISVLEQKTQYKNGLHLNIALNYGGQDEILRAVRKMCTDFSKGSFSADDIDKVLFENYLDTKDVPAPDLLIRTAGEMRISNFLLWQIAYCEFYFSQKLWPDFSKDDLLDAIKSFSARKRRFGRR